MAQIQPGTCEKISRCLEDQRRTELGTTGSQRGFKSTWRKVPPEMGITVEFWRMTRPVIIDQTYMMGRISGGG